MSDASDHYFGECPICRRTNGCLHVGKSHWFFCDEHRVRWNVGSNLISSWRDQTEEEQRAIYNAKDFGSYRIVEPYFTPPMQWGAKTYRDVAKDRLVQTICESIGGSPWIDEVEEGLKIFFAKFDTAIEANPFVAEIFNRPTPSNILRLDDDTEIPF
jgi:hypothetical protein